MRVDAINNLILESNSLIVIRSSLQNTMDEKLYQERAILCQEGRERLKRAKQTIARADALLDPRL